MARARGGKRRKEEKMTESEIFSLQGPWQTLQWGGHQENNIRTQLLPPSARPQRTRCCSVFSLACSACSHGVCRHRKPNRLLQSIAAPFPCSLFRRIPSTFRSGPFFARERRKERKERNQQTVPAAFSPPASNNPPPRPAHSHAQNSNSWTHPHTINKTQVRRNLSKKDIHPPPHSPVAKPTHRIKEGKEKERKEKKKIQS